MDKANDRANQVRARIKSAFRGMRYPGNPLAFAVGDWEGDAIDRAFRDKDWSEISTRMVKGQMDRLPLLKPTARALYLPAYMLACLDDREGDHVHFTVMALESPMREPPAHRSFTSYTTDQCAAVVAFLRWILMTDTDGIYTPEDALPGDPALTDDGPAQALRSYWLLASATEIGDIEECVADRLSERS